MVPWVVEGHLSGTMLVWDPLSRMACHVVRSQGKGLDSRNCQMIFHWVSLNTFELILLCIRSPWPLHPATKIRKAKLYMVFHHMQASKLIWDDFGDHHFGKLPYLELLRTIFKHTVV